MRVYASAEMTLTDTNDGISVTGIDRYYMASSYSSGITVDSSGWKPEPQETNSLSRYHWSYEVVNYSSGPPVPSKPAIIGVYGKDGVAGKDSIVGYLTNEAIVLPANSEGIVSNYELSEGYFKVYDGLTEVSNQADYSEVTGDNITINLNTVTGQYVVINMEKSQDEGYFDIKATYKGVEIIKRISVTKSKQGVQGEKGFDAKLLYLSATAEAMTFNANNTPNPATQTVSFTANLQNTTGTATFTATPYNGNTAMSAITLGGSGNTRTLTQSQFPATATRIEIKAVLGGLVDTVSVAKLKNGLDGENSVVGYLTNESISIPTSSSGTFTPANLAKATGTFRVFDGLTEKTKDASVEFNTSTKVGLDGSITSDGIYTVTSLDADVATLELKATYKGVTIYKTLTVVKSRAGVDGVSITKIFNEYAVNDSPTTAPTAGWDEVAPSRTSGEYLWVREKVNYSNSSSEITGTRMVTGDKGDIGLDGKNALSVMLLNESQSVASTSGRKATDAQIIKIPFTAFVGTTRTSCTASVGTLPSGVTLGSITNGTSSTDGVITLNVAKDATLGGTTSQFDTGSIEVTITANNIGVKKFFNWTKSVSGANGTTARTFFTESDVSVIVKKEDGSYTPSSFTFYSYYKDGTTANKTAYARFWKIETTVDGGNWTTYKTKVDTASTTYTITSIPQNIVGIRATTYSTNALTSSHDTQSVMVVTDGESGISITNVIAEYSVNNSKTTAPTTGWQETQPNRPAGSFIWRRDRILYSDDSDTITKPVVMTGDKGDSGESAKLLYLSSNLENMIFNSDNTPNPSNQTATIEAKLQNVSGTVVYSATAYNGATSIGSVVLGGTGNTKTLSIKDFPENASHVSVKATLGSLTDTISIFKIRHGEKGFDGGTGPKGDNSIVGYLTNESVTLGASSTGAVSSFTPAKGTFRVFDGITEVTTNSACEFSLNASTGVTLTINSSGVYTVTAMNADTATAEFKAVYKNITIIKTMSLSKSRVGEKGDPGEQGPDGISPIVGFLTNESITLPASDEGVVPSSSFASATGTLNVYEGTVLKNAQATYSVVSQSSITVSITQAGVYKVSAMTTGASVLSGTATLRAEYGGVTIDKILTVTKALAGTQGGLGPQGPIGPDGKNATSYWINASVNAIKKDATGAIVPKTITFSGFSKTGTSNPVAYAGRFIIQISENGTSYTTRYTSSANQSSYTYTIPATASFVKARYYLAGGTSVLLDEQTIPVLVDAEGINYGGKTQEELNNMSHIYFNNDGYIEFPDEAKNLVHGGTEATIEFWNKQDSLSYGLLQLSGFADSNGILYPYQNYTTAYLDVFRTNRTGPITMKKPVDIWHHFAVTTHPTEGWKLYQDGVLVYTTSAQPTVNTSYLKFRVGNNSGNRYSNAGYRDIRLWNVARSNVDIISNMNTDLLGNESGLVGYWKVSENVGETVKDLVNGNDGLITNGVWKGSIAETNEQLGNKADIEVIDNLKNDLNDYTNKEDYLAGIGEVNSSLESYKSLLETIERDLKGERDENGEFILDVDGNPIDVGAIKEIEDIVNREAVITHNLGELSERWSFIGTNIIMATEGLLIGETEINEDGEETLITGIRVSKDRVDFVENKVIVAEITGQRMKINRAIFVQSISVGEHKIETVSSGHTIWTWSPIV